MEHSTTDDTATDAAPTRHPAGFPLALAVVGERLEIAGLRSGEGVERRLAAMGLRPGSRCEVVQNERPGGLVLRMGESRMALGMGMAHKILVVRRP